MRTIAITLVAAVVSGCGPKTPPEPAAPRVGWVQDEGWPGACWYPPNFEEQAGGARRIARSEAMTQMVSQWRGERGDGISLPDDLVTAVETTLLGHPDRVEWVAAENVAQCEQAMRRGGDTHDWSAWLREVNGRLREGLCPYAPLDYTLFDYLSITSPWHITRKVCAGDTFDVKASSVDYYRISADGPWITAAGDPDQPAIGSDLPCNVEGCYRGQVILLFEGDDGTRQVVPVGHGTRFTAPGHGQISVQINDNTWGDNVYKIESGMQHHTSIEYDGEP